MSIADGVDELELLRTEMPRGQSTIVAGIIARHLLPAIALAAAMRDAAAQIESDGTPSQVGPTSDELCAWADAIQPSDRRVALGRVDVGRDAKKDAIRGAQRTALRELSGR